MSVSDVWSLVRLTLALVALWVVPWWGPSGLVLPGRGAARALVAFFVGICVTVVASYLLVLVGAYRPLSATIASLIFSGIALLAIRWRGLPSVPPPTLLVAVGAAAALRLPDALRHESLGGNDPWGHLVLCKALAGGDALASFHPFSFYPRGFHALVLVLSTVSGVSLYDVMRLAAPLLSAVGVVGSYAVARVASDRFGGLVAAFLYAVPAYRHLVLPALQTSLEPDRFVFAFLPASLLLLLEALEGNRRAALLLAAGEAIHLLVHPLSVQFSLGWIACAAVVASPRARRALELLSVLFVVALFSWAYFHVMNRSFGVTVMPHLSPPAAFAVGGFGVDLGRFLLGTGWHLEAMDGVAAGAALTLLGVGILRRRAPVVLLGLVLVHTAYAAVRDALYIGDFGHAPPYYAMAFSWAVGSLAGFIPPVWRPTLPVAGMLVLLAHALSSPLETSRVIALAVAGMVAALSVARRGGYEAVFLGVALCSLRPEPVRYARLGYPEAVRWARELEAAPPGVVYSSGLISRMPNGRPFPTQDPVASIVWPVHRPRSLTALLEEDPCREWPRGERAYVFVEHEPCGWTFSYFAAAERDSLMGRVRRWLVRRASCGGLVRTLQSSGRMSLLALHEEGA